MANKRAGGQEGPGCEMHARPFQAKRFGLNALSLLQTSDRSLRGVTL